MRKKEQLIPSFVIKGYTNDNSPIDFRIAQGFSINKEDATIELLDAGGEVLGHPLPIGDYDSIFIENPNGNTIESIKVNVNDDTFSIGGNRGKVYKIGGQ